MAFVGTDGTECVDPVIPARPRRGRRLTDEQIKLWNDWVYRLMVGYGELSPSDARRVMDYKVGDRCRRKRHVQIKRAERQRGSLFMLMADLVKQAEELSEHGDAR